MICVFDKNAKRAEVENYNGLAVLEKCIDAIIESKIENSDTIITLSFSYLVSEEKSKYLKKYNIIKVPFLYGHEYFRISKSRKSDTYVDIIATHITNDLDDNFLLDSRPTNMTRDEAIKHIKSDLMISTEIDMNSNITAKSTAYYIRKNFVEAINGTDDNAFIKRWGGEIKREGYKLSIVDKIGQDTGFRVAYGENILGIEEQVEDNEVTRAVVTVRKGQDAVELPEKYLDSPLLSKYPFPRVKHVDFSDLDIDKSTEQAIFNEARNKVKAMFNVDMIDRPRINFKVNFFDLNKTDINQSKIVFDRMKIGDTCLVKYEKLDIDIKARLTYSKYDCIKDRYIELTLTDTAVNIFN